MTLFPPPPPADADDAFAFTESITDDDLVASFTGRGRLVGGHIEALMINSCGSQELCARIQKTCSIPVVVGWSAAEVPGALCLAMVRQIAGCHFSDVGTTPSNVSCLCVLMMLLTCSRTCI